MTGVDYGNLLGIGDMFFSEEFNPVLTESGSIFSRKRTFLAAAATGSYAVTYAERNANCQTALAESMALGKGCIGAVKYCTLFDKAVFSDEWVAYLNFFNSNKILFAQDMPECRINILRNFESLAFDSVESHAQILAFEQFLIDNSYEYRILFDKNVTEMKNSNNGVLIAVINQPYLPDAICEKLTTLAQKGATLLITGNSAKYDAWGRNRKIWGFAKLFGTETFPGNNMLQADFGKGQAVYVKSFSCRSAADTKTANEAEDLGQMKSLKYFTHPLYSNPPSPSRPEYIKKLLEMLIGDISEFEVVEPSGEVRIERSATPDGSCILHIINYGDTQAAKTLFIRLKGRLRDINVKSLKAATPHGKIDVAAKNQVLEVEMQSAYGILSFKLNNQA
jgi:hypothetical protein